MKPRIAIAEVTTPNGGRLVLEQHDSDYYVRMDGSILMSTRSTVSERFLADVVARRLAGCPEPRVLVGGLGFGFTARELWDQTGGRAEIVVAELFEEVISWNRTYLTEFNGGIADKKGVSVVADDVWNLLSPSSDAERFDAVLLDVDNGASALVQRQNGRLYSRRGLHRIASALRPRGQVAIWSASADFAFSRRLNQTGFEVEEIPVRAHERARRSAHVVYLARKTGAVAPLEPETRPARSDRSKGPARPFRGGPRRGNAGR